MSAGCVSVSDVLVALVLVLSLFALVLSGWTLVQTVRMERRVDRLRRDDAR